VTPTHRAGGTRLVGPFNRFANVVRCIRQSVTHSTCLDSIPSGLHHLAADHESCFPRVQPRTGILLRIVNRWPVFGGGLEAIESELRFDYFHGPYAPLVGGLKLNVVVGVGVPAFIGGIKFVELVEDQENWTQLAGVSHESVESLVRTVFAVAEGVVGTVGQRVWIGATPTTLSGGGRNGRGSLRARPVAESTRERRPQVIEIVRRRNVNVLADRFLRAFGQCRNRKDYDRCKLVEARLLPDLLRGVDHAHSGRVERNENQVRPVRAPALHVRIFTARWIDSIDEIAVALEKRFG
jgi:hypothetical protein